MSTSSPPGDQNGSANGDMEDKPRLSKAQKDQNHIASEQKRRKAIRAGFDRLAEIVPGLHGQGRSESVVLRKTVDYMKEVTQEQKKLEAAVRELGGTIEDDPQDSAVKNNRHEYTQNGYHGDGDLDQSDNE